MLPRISVSIPALADAFEAWARALDWLSGIKGVHPVVVDRSPDGPVVSLAEPTRRTVKLTSAGASSGSYNASEVYPDGSGGWAVPTGGWTGVVWEYNLFAGITTPAYAEVEWHGASGDWRFQLGGCS